MSETFNGVMRAINSLVGLLMVATGAVWMLQGFNLAFRTGFMVGDKRWALYGAIAMIIGICEIVWSNTREQYYKDR